MTPVDYARARRLARITINRFFRHLAHHDADADAVAHAWALQQCVTFLSLSRACRQLSKALAYRRPRRGGIRAYVKTEIPKDFL